MEAIILIGLQASGKSSFFKERFFTTHVRINLDMLKTRHREKRFLETCLEAGQRFVVDNTNPSRAEREQYIVPARQAKFRVIGYYFQSQIEECLARNATRPSLQQVPVPGIRGTFARLELPRRVEGFDELHYVVMNGDGGFTVKEWRDEV